MQKYMHVLLLIVIALTLASCAVPDPFKADQIEAEANAEATRQQAAQDAQDREITRQHQEELNTIDELKARMHYEQQHAIWTAAAEDIKAGMSFAIRWILFMAAIVTIGATALIGRHAVGETQRLITGVTSAAITYVDIRSRLIPLDEKTGQFPAFVQLEHTSRHTYALADLNGRVLMTLDERDPGDAQMIAGMIAIREVGVATRNTRLAKKDVADAVPLSTNPSPRIIDAPAYDVKSMSRELGTDFVRNLFARAHKEDGDADL
jgi:hypothetical protein